MLRLLAQTFPTYTKWSQHVVDAAEMTGQARSVFGWPMQVVKDTKSTTLKNFPMQSGGAEMMRLATTCLATEAGVEVCAPVHDALLVESSVQDIDETVANTQAAMSESCKLILVAWICRQKFAKLSGRTDTQMKKRGGDVEQGNRYFGAYSCE